MSELIFDRNHALKALGIATEKGLDWLYSAYRKPNGKMRKSSTGFLMHEGTTYPVKPLGRLANELAGQPMKDNPITNVFRKHFETLGFTLINSPDDEAEKADQRQRGLAEIWERPGQAKFRRKVFETFGARCLVTGCETLIALEAAHVLPVSQKGGDKAWNGIPLRADLHRLFDAGALSIDPDSWKVVIDESMYHDYGQFHGKSLAALMTGNTSASKLAGALKKREIIVGNEGKG